MALPAGSVGSMGCGNPNSEVIYDLDDLVALADVKGHDLIKPEPNVGWLCKAVDHLRPHLLQARYFVLLCFQGLFLSVLPKTQFPKNAKTQIENPKTQFGN